MDPRFTSNVVLTLIGGALAAVAVSLGLDVTAWAAVAVGVAAIVIALTGFASLARGAGQRRADVVTVLLAGSAVALVRTLSGDPVKWIAFGAGCGLVVLGVLGLVLHETAAAARRAGRPQPVRTAVAAIDTLPSSGPPPLPPEGSWRGPLAGSYWSAAFLVVFALVPYLILATTVNAVGKQIGADVGLGEQAMSLTDGMSNAAYAVSTVIALQFTVHLRGRRLLVGYAALFVIGSVLAAWAPTPGLFVAGRVVQGGATGLMLIAAVPPLVIGWPPARLTTTAMVMNMGIFGAVAAGPVIGGTVAGMGDSSWRGLFWIVCGLGFLAFSLSILTFSDQQPQDRSAPWAPGALLLAGGGCAATFFGSAELTTHPFVSVWVMLPLLSGLAMIALLVIGQYVSKNPLMPVRRLTSTFPVAGIIVAICAGASSVSVIGLVEAAKIAQGESPQHVGLLFLPQFAGAIVAAGLFGLLFRTKYTKIIAITGLVCIAAGAAILTGVATGPDRLVWIGSGLLGFGVGASVAPALFVAGFSLPSNNIPRIFALIELLRAVAAFSVAPILVHISLTVGGDPATGTRTAIWICLGIASAGSLAAVYLFVLARARPHHPKIDRWIGGAEPAFDSPALAAALRHLPTDPADESDAPVPTGTSQLRSLGR